MKELKKGLLLALLLIGVAMASCSDGDDGVLKTIELTGDTPTTQILFADETTTNDGIKFTATEAWGDRFCRGTEWQGAAYRGEIGQGL